MFFISAMIIEQDNSKYFTVGEKYYEIPDRRCKAFFKGKEFYFSEKIGDFLQSDKDSCVVPVYCDSVSEKRAFKSVTIETVSEEYRFTNSERGQYSYYRNEIKDIEQGCVYLLFLEKFSRARNDCLIKAATKIEQQEPIDVGVCHSFLITGKLTKEEKLDLIEQMDKILSHG